jgi:hypothetical protein
MRRQWNDVRNLNLHQNTSHRRYIVHQWRHTVEWELTRWRHRVDWEPTRWRHRVDWEPTLWRHKVDVNRRCWKDSQLSSARVKRRSTLFTLAQICQSTKANLMSNLNKCLCTLQSSDFHTALNCCVSVWPWMINAISNLSKLSSEKLEERKRNEEN